MNEKKDLKIIKILHDIQNPLTSIKMTQDSNSINELNETESTISYSNEKSLDINDEIANME